MSIKIEKLIEATKGMNPVQFERYCDINQIQIEWLDVSPNDFNEGIYNVTLPVYLDINVFAINGSAIEIEYDTLN